MMYQSRYTFNFNQRDVNAKESIMRKETILDLSYLDRVVDGAEHLKLELISIFINVVSKELEDIAYWYEEQEWKPLCFSFHKIRSNLRMMGFLWLAHKAGEYEKCCVKSENLELIENEIDWFLEELTKAILQAEVALGKNQC